MSVHQGAHRYGKLPPRVKALIDYDNFIGISYKPKRYQRNIDNEWYFERLDSLLDRLALYFGPDILHSGR